MTRSFPMRLLTTFVAIGLSCSQASAQTSTHSTGNSGDPNDINVYFSWPGCGTPPKTQCYSGWQVDHGTITTTLTSETGFAVVPPNGFNPLQVSVTLPAPTTIHEVHGNVTFTVWSTSSCSVGSVIAQVRNQNGNNVASVNLEDITSNSSDDLPIKGTFPNGLSITSLELQTFSSQCGAVTLSWSLVMS